MRAASIAVTLLAAGCSMAEPQPTAGRPVAVGPDRSRPSPTATATESTRNLAEPPEAPAVEVGPRPTPTSGAEDATAPCPSDMVLIGRFCIDRYEAHLRAITPAGLGEVHPHNQRPAAGTSYVAVSQRGVFPQGYVSRVEAQAACIRAGKRLCSRTEWKLACRGTPVAPAGDAAARPCNNGKAHLLSQLFGGGWDYEAHFNDPELNEMPGFLAKTGDHGACRSELGVYDMVGNLHEWVSGTVTRRFLTELAAEGVSRQYQHVQLGNGIFMGGFYSTTGELGPGCLFTTVAHDAGYHDYSTGFRCCRAKR